MTDLGDTARLKRLYDEVRSLFFIAPDLDQLFAVGDAQAAHFGRDSADAWAAFRSNLSSLIAALEVPYELAHAGVLDRLYQQFAAAGPTARADPARVVPDEDPTSPDGRRNLDRVRRDARERVEEFRAAAIGRNHIVEAIGVLLMRSVAEPPFARSSQELLLQGAMMCWAAYEALATRAIRQLVDAGAVGATTSIEPRDAEAIASVFESLSPTNASLQAALASPALRLLCERHRLIARRGGSIDAGYASAAGLSPDAIGRRLQLRPSDLRRHLSAVIAAGLQIAIVTDRLVRDLPDAKTHAD